MSSTYGGHYTRVAWALFAILVIDVSLPCAANAPRARAGSDAVGSGLGTGIVVGLLLGLKFTFCLAALGMIALAAWYRPWSWRRWLGLCLGLIVAVWSGLALSGAHLGAYAHDCFSLRSSTPLRWLLWEYKRQLDVSSLALLAAAAWWAWPRLAEHWKPSLRQPLPEIPALAACCLALGLVLSATTGIEETSPCAILALMVVAAGCCGLSMRSSSPHWRMRAGPWLILLAMLLPASFRLAEPIVKGPYMAASHQLVVDSGPWSGLDFMPAVSGSTERAGLLPYVWIQPRNLIDNLWYLYLSDGMRLLGPRMGVGERVLSMDYINPFSYALVHPAPRGDLLYWSFDRNVTAQSAPAAPLLFADAQWVLVPRESRSSMTHRA